MKTSDAQEIFEQKMKVMRARFVCSLDQRAMEIELCMDQLSEPSRLLEVSKEVALLAHKLKGTSMTLGLDRLGNIAKDLEWTGLKNQGTKSEYAELLTGKARALIREIRRIRRSEIRM
ncbi:MAG: Hpt domain-containing protein [Pseudorhodoplanes sp.]|nr:Hpt domain-containing protein [Pseudorhodoplanes sp.]